MIQPMTEQQQETVRLLEIAVRVTALIAGSPTEQMLAEMVRLDLETEQRKVMAEQNLRTLKLKEMAKPTLTQVSKSSFLALCDL